MKVILTEPANNGGDNACTGHFMPLPETSSSGNGLYLVESLAIGSPWKPPAILVYCQDYWLLSVNWCIKTLLLKTTLTYFIEHGEVKLVLN